MPHCVTFGQCLLMLFMSSSYSWVGSTAQDCNHRWYVFSCGLCLVTIHWLTLLHANWSGIIFDHWVIPSRGALPLGPVLGSLVRAPTLFGKQGLMSYLLNLWLATSYVESHPHGLIFILIFPLWQICQKFTFCLVNILQADLSNAVFSHGWRFSFVSWR